MSEDFDLCNAAEYRREFGRLAGALERPDSAPSSSEMEFLAWITGPAASNFGGMLSGPEIRFAAGVTSILRPDLAIEIGTSSGFSAAILAKIIDLGQTTSRRDGIAPLVHTIDKRSVCYSDPSKPIGYAIEAMVPELKNRIRLHMECDSSCCDEIARGEAMIGFVDGNHCHPWPLCDVLELCRLIRDGWILMHDIDLPDALARARLAGQQTQAGPAFGAKHVFDLWPDRKLRSGNIGAIRIPDDLRSLSDFVRQMRTLPTEVSPNGWNRRWQRIDELLAPRGLARWKAWIGRRQ